MLAIYVPEVAKMVDTDLLVATLRAHGHTVGHVIPISANAGTYEFEIDGEVLTLEEARALIEEDEVETTHPLK
jgi:hypothetical protein